MTEPEITSVEKTPIVKNPGRVAAGKRLATISCHLWDAERNHTQRDKEEPNEVRQLKEPKEPNEVRQPKEVNELNKPMEPNEVRQPKFQAYSMDD